MSISRQLSLYLAMIARKATSSRTLTAEQVLQTLHAIPHRYFRSEVVIVRNRQRTMQREVAVRDENNLLAVRELLEKLMRATAPHKKGEYS